jgi:hypothetical protein
MHDATGGTGQYGLITTQRATRRHLLREDFGSSYWRASVCDHLWKVRKLGSYGLEKIVSVDPDLVDAAALSEFSMVSMSTISFSFRSLVRSSKAAKVEAAAEIGTS